MHLKVFRIHSKLIELVWPNEINELILKEQLFVKKFLLLEYGEGIREIRMGFNTLSLKLKFDISPSDCLDLLEEIHQLPIDTGAFDFKKWTIPVCYGESYGKDLEKISKLHQLNPKEVIEIHSNPVYLLHFYGFLPGFMYLGGLDPRLHTPRKDLPERLIQAGTVAIGGRQTGIYPMESPGGWYAIGKCPIKLFDINNNLKNSPSIGDRIKFKAISPSEFECFQQESIAGKFTLTHD